MVEFMLKPPSLAKIPLLASFLLSLDVLSFTAMPTAFTHNTDVPVIPKVQEFEDKPLRLTVTVNDPASLRVREGNTVKQGDILADNFRERSRLTVQKQTIFLQVGKLRDQQLIAPLPSRKLPPLKPLPEVDYIQETAAISQARLRLRQAKSILATRFRWLNRPKDSAYNWSLD
jgi:hypothetical protein